MYVDETGTDTTDHGADTSAEGLTVTVDGEDYQVDETYDVNHDGTNDTAVVQGDDGTSIAFTDVDGDHHADVSVKLDANGNVEGAARYDESTGEWVAVDPHSGQPATGEAGVEQTGTADPAPAPDGGASGAPAGGPIRVDVPDEAEDRSAGTATVDMNDDGTADTAIVREDDGTVVGFTDTDADGEADVMTTIDAQGNVTIAQHGGEDEWTEVERGRVDEQGNFTPEAGSPQSAATIDPATGQWVG